MDNVSVEQIPSLSRPSLIDNSTDNADGVTLTSVKKNNGEDV